MKFKDILENELKRGVSDSPTGQYFFNHHQEAADELQKEMVSKLSVDKYNRKVQLNKTFWEDEL